MHALIVGDPGTGKSTLIRNVLARLGKPSVGFETWRDMAAYEESRGAPIYLCPVGLVPAEKNLVGWSLIRDRAAAAPVFDRIAPVLLAQKAPGTVILMDELGILESQAQEFQKAVFILLDGSLPVIAAVKPKETAFLQAVRSHPNCRVFRLTLENRDALTEEVYTFLLEQTKDLRLG